MAARNVTTGADPALIVGCGGADVGGVDLVERHMLAGLRALAATAGVPGHELSELQARTDVAVAFLHRLVADGLMPTPQRYLSGLLQRFHPVLRRGCDPCRAEIAACQFLGSLLPAAPDGTVPDNTVPDNTVPDNSVASGSLVELMTQIEACGTREALAALRALAVVASPPARSTAGAAADRLAAAGLQDPTWAAGIGTPATGACRSYAANGQRPADRGGHVDLPGSPGARGGRARRPPARWRGQGLLGEPDPGQD
ncbi:MAG TPA: hypothetical protein VHN80_24340, partial [Kineosporiaceae bacterium]|nr:hypothetical protein [Kineosporiaceae bacterium]